MNINEQASNKVVFLALTATNFFYFIIVATLHLAVGTPINETGGTVFAIGFTISTILMSYVSIKAIREDADRSKTIIKLAILHVPCMIGMTVFFVYGFAVVSWNTKSI